MRWQRLFDDLEAQLREAGRAELAADVADRTRRERALVSLADRLMAQREPLELLLLGGHRVTGLVRDVGADWLTVDDAAGRSWLIPMGSMVALTGLGRAVDRDLRTTVVRRFPFGTALRTLARDRSPVVLRDTLGRALTGTIDVVGADLVELSEHPLDLPRRPENIVGVRVIPYAAMVCLASGL